MIGYLTGGALSNYYTKSEIDARSSSQWNTSGTTINYMSGNVGIGTANPTQALDVSGGSVRITNATLGNSVAPLVVQNTNAYADPYTQYSQLRLGSAGNVIGYVRNDGTLG